MMHCDICGDRIDLAQSWPGTKRMYRTCVGGNECTKLLGEKLGAQFNAHLAKYGFPLGDKHDTIWFPPDDWWWKPNPGEVNSMRVDVAMRELSRVPISVCHGAAGLPSDGKFKVLSAGSQYNRDTCVVCKAPRAEPHTLRVSDGEVIAHLCCGTCDVEVLAEEARRERNFLCAAMDGIFASVKACEKVHEQARHRAAKLRKHTKYPDWSHIHTTFQPSPAMTDGIRGPHQNAYDKALSDAWQHDPNTPIMPHTHSSVLAHESSDKLAPMSPCFTQPTVEGRFRGYDYKAKEGSEVRAGVDGAIDAICSACNGTGSNTANIDGEDAICSACSGSGSIDGTSCSACLGRGIPLPKTPRNVANKPPPQAFAGDLGKLLPPGMASGEPPPEAWRVDGPPLHWSSLPGPASEESPPPHPVIPGRCYDCREPVHTAAPARDGRWYCETCVGWRTYLEETDRRIERLKAQLAEDEARVPPMPGRTPKVLLTGDLFGPKV